MASLPKTLPAPSGHKKPAAPPGYTAVGLGKGRWVFHLTNANLAVASGNRGLLPAPAPVAPAAPPAPAPPAAPDPVMPFLTDSQQQDYINFDKSYHINLDSLNHALDVNTADYNQAMSDAGTQHTRNVSAEQQSAAARGLLGSSIDLGDLGDLNLTLALNQNRLTDNYNNAQFNTDQQIRALNNDYDTGSAQFDVLRAHNAAGADALAPPPTPPAAPAPPSAPAPAKPQTPPRPAGRSKAQPISPHKTVNALARAKARSKVGL